MYRNICLIGLPFSGKTSLGKKLSKRCHLGFLETDKMIEYKYRGSLPKILEYTSHDNFLYKEEAIATTVDCYNTIISTGGSIVYSNESMKHFQINLQCKVIHLDISFNTFKERVEKTCFESRGIVNPNNLNMKDFYFQRQNLYQLYSDVSITMDDKNMDFKKLINETYDVGNNMHEKKVDPKMLDSFTTI